MSTPANRTANYVTNSRNNLTEHLAKCKTPGRCVECEILLTMFCHWSQNLGIVLTQDHTRFRWHRRRH